MTIVMAYTKTIMERVVHTIGHSTHAIGRFLALLKQHEITAVADVRSQPYSRMNPQFNREPLEADLEAAGIEYVFMGRELGARSDDPACYVDGKVSYDRLAAGGLFQDGLDRIVRGAARYRLALMCAERDPLVCHRTILVSRHLVARGFEVRHILEDGRLEDHEAAVDRLLRDLEMADQDLFRDRAQIVAEAYDRRGREIAYALPDSSAGQSLRGAAGR